LLDGARVGERGRFAAELRRLDREARRRSGRGFSACLPAEQDLLLAEAVADPRPERRRFLHGLVLLCLAGFLGDPVHGGNRGGVGWELIGWQPDPRREGARIGQRR
jgi:hypothetical protein